MDEKRFEKAIIDRVVKMGEESLSPELFEGLVKAADAMAINRHLVVTEMPAK